MIAVTPDFRVGPCCRIDVLFFLVGRKPGQLERPVRVQDRVSLRAVSVATTAAGRRTALAAGRTGPAGRRGHGRRAAAGRRTRRRGVSAGGQVPGPDVRLDGRERLLPGQAPGTSGRRLEPEDRRRDAVYDVAQPAGVGRVRNGRYARLWDQVLGAHRPVVHVATAAAATAAVRRPLQPAAPRRANRNAQALLFFFQVRDLTQGETSPVFHLHQQRRGQRALQAFPAQHRARQGVTGDPGQVQRHRVPAAHLVHGLQHDGRKRAAAVLLLRRVRFVFRFQHHVVRVRNQLLLFTALACPELFPLLLILPQVFHHRVRQLGVQKPVPQIEQRQHHELEEH